MIAPCAGPAWLHPLQAGAWGGRVRRQRPTPAAAAAAARTPAPAYVAAALPAALLGAPSVLCRSWLRWCSRQRRRRRRASPAAAQVRAAACNPRTAITPGLRWGGRRSWKGAALLNAMQCAWADTCRHVGRPTGAERKSKRARKGRAPVTVDSSHTLQVGMFLRACRPAACTQPRGCARLCKPGGPSPAPGLVLWPLLPPLQVCRSLASIPAAPSAAPAAAGLPQPDFPGAGGAPAQRAAVHQARCACCVCCVCRAMVSGTGMPQHAGCRADRRPRWRVCCAGVRRWCRTRAPRWQSARCSPGTKSKWCELEAAPALG